MRRKKRERVCLRTGSREMVVVVVFLQLFFAKGSQALPYRRIVEQLEGRISLTKFLQ